MSRMPTARELFALSRKVLNVTNAAADSACDYAFPGAPKAVKNTVAGIATGFVVGTAIGGVGVAAMGGAIGVPTAAVLACAGGVVGNRIGVRRDSVPRARRPTAASSDPSS